MELATLPLSSWNRFLTRNLSVEPSLIGAKHKFEYEAHTICVELPSARHVPTEPCDGERLRFNHYTEVDGRKNPLSFWVESVDVTVIGADKVSLPSEILRHSPNQTELLSADQQEKLNGLVAVLGAVADKTFDLWVRTLRWKTGNSAIGRPEVSGHESGWSTYLVAQPNGERVWIAPFTIVAKGVKAVTSATWEAVGSALREGHPPPLFVDLLMDAMEHAKTGDFQRATVETAMSCEIFLRTLLAESLPLGLQPSVSEYVDDANIRAVLKKFMPDVLTPEEMKGLERIRSKLHKLFDARNAIVHKGLTNALSKTACDEFIAAAMGLIGLRSSTARQEANKALQSDCLHGARSGNR